MKKPSLRFLLAGLNVVGFIAVVAVNVLATAVPLGGKTPGQLSDQYPNLFVPAGLTFSIWGMIYILLGIFVVYGLLHSIRIGERNDSFLRKTGILFFITCAANAGWIFSWQYELLPLSLVCMVILLVTLAAIYLRLNVGRSNAEPREKYLVHLPMSVYFGWITVATIANVTALLVAYKWDRFGIGEQTWAIIMIGIGTVLALVTLFYRRDLFYALVVDWALVGILIKRTSEGAIPAQGVVTASIVCMCLLTACMIVQLARSKVYRS